MSKYPENSSATECTVSRSFVWLAAIAVAVIVSNIFAPQMFLAQIGESLGVSTEVAASVSTLTLLGYATGLCFLVPLIDLIENKRVIVATLFVTIITGLIAATVSNFYILLASVFFMGASCSVIQMLVPLIASMAGPAERGQVIGDVMSGLMIGILLSRPAAGFIADVWNWRAFYIATTTAVAVLTVSLAFWLPKRQPVARGNYLSLIASFYELLLNEPVLRVRSWTAALVSAAFAAFWVSVALRLSSPPFSLGLREIAAFAFVGAAGAIAAPLAGRIADRGWARRTLIVSHILIIVAAALSACAAFIEVSLFALITLGLASVLLDVGITSDQTIGRRAVIGLRPEAAGRLNALLVALFFVGQAIGATAAAWTWIHGGWIAICCIIALFGLLALVTDMATEVGSS